MLAIVALVTLVLFAVRYFKHGELRWSYLIAALLVFLYAWWRARQGTQPRR